MWLALWIGLVIVVAYVALRLAVECAVGRFYRGDGDGSNEPPK